MSFADGVWLSKAGDPQNNVFGKKKCVIARKRRWFKFLEPGIISYFKKEGNAPDTPTGTIKLCSAENESTNLVLSKDRETMYLHTPGTARVFELTGQAAIIRRLTQELVDSQTVVCSNLCDDDLEWHGELGAGAFGVVSLATWEGKRVAVKTLTVDMSHDSFAALDFTKEIACLGKLRSHPNTVTLFGFGQRQHGEPFLVTNFAERGSLRTALANAGDDAKAKMEWPRKLQMALDVARGMQFLHNSVACVHRDLKSDNVLIGHDWTCFVADFGTSRLVDKLALANATVTTPDPELAVGMVDEEVCRQVDVQLTTLVGTLPYMAPEILLRKETGYGQSADVYSFGMLMWELWSETRPWCHLPTSFFGNALAAALEHGDRPTFTEMCESRFRELAEICWCTAEEDRPPFDAVVVTLETIVPCPDAANGKSVINAHEAHAALL